MQTENTHWDFTALCVYIMSRDYSFVYWSPFSSCPHFICWQLQGAAAACSRSYSDEASSGPKIEIQDLRAEGLALCIYILLKISYCLNTGGQNVFRIIAYSLSDTTGRAWLESLAGRWSRVMQADSWHYASDPEYWITWPPEAFDWLCWTGSDAITLAPFPVIFKSFSAWMV